MVSSRVLGLGMRGVLVTLLAGTASCATVVRVPLAVPLPAVGGGRPATPQGLQLIGEFGDGVWGQEQERAEMAGAGLGGAWRDRFEFSVVGYESTRRPGGDSGESTLVFRGKIRLGDFGGDKASIGIHTAYMTSERERVDVQNERLTALDVAFPVEFYPLGEQSPEHRLGLYAAPRLVFQTIEDRMTAESTKGTMAGGLLGVAGRWRFVALTGELNFVHTATMTLGGTTFQGTWLVLPMAGLRLILPIGD